MRALAIWLGVGIIHIVAFPSGSWMHPYWFWYLIPAVAGAAGMLAAALWGSRRSGLRVVLRIGVVALLLSFACEARETLRHYHEVPKAPSGNPLLDRPLPASLQTFCRYCAFQR